MHNVKSLVIGSLIIIVVFTAPYWVGKIGKPYTATDIVLPHNEKSCVEDTQFMRSQHMRLLNEWRDEALRNENRSYISAKDNKRWTISLQNTCMKCHKNYSTFCEKCHVANSVYPYCWTCHIRPTEAK